MEIKFTIAENLGAPAAHRFNACLGEYDLDVVLGHGLTPIAAIQDLIDTHIDDLDIQVMGMTEYRKAMKLEVKNA